MSEENSYMIRKFLLVTLQLALLSTFGCAQDTGESEAQNSPKENQEYQNSLQYSNSPYLLQHADNPVDWHPWGKEAFEKAEEEEGAFYVWTKSQINEAMPERQAKVFNYVYGLKADGNALQDPHDVLGDEQYKEHAVQSAKFLKDKLYNSKTGQFKRTYRDGEAEFAANMEDYAYLVKGLIDLYEATGNERWLNDATQFIETQIDLFL